MIFGSWRERARELLWEICVLSLAIRDPRTPWYARVLAAGIVAYALSPLDLIPDPIPVLGYLDDIVLLPLAVLLVMRLIPAHVMVDARERAAAQVRSRTPRNRIGLVGAGLVVLLWIATGGLLVFFSLRYLA